MKHVKVTQGTYGYVSCFIDDELFNYVNSMGSSGRTIYSGTTFNENGIAFRNAIGSTGINDFKGTILTSLAQDQLNMEAPMTLIHKLFPNINYTMTGTVPISPSDYEVKLYAGNSYFRIRQLASTSIIVNWFSKGSTLSAGGFGDNNQSSPFGFVTTQSIALSFAIFKEDQTDCCICRVSCGYASSTQTISILKIKSSTATPLSQMVAWFDLPDLNGDPYNGGGTTGGGGGGGTFDDTTDPQTFPPVPTLSVTNVKFVKLYTPTESELIGISNWLWSTDFNIDNLKKLFSNPMDCILGLSVVPVLPDHGTPDTVVVGNISAPNTVLARPITNQYKIKNFGTLNVEEYWGSYLDYDPYTKIEIYLPFIGIEQISTDDVMGKIIELQYNIDVLSGACVAMLMCNNNILYQFAGNCAMGLPLVGRDMLSVITGAVNVISKGVTAIGGIATGTAGGIASAVTALTSASTDAMRSKRNIQKSGTISGTPGFMGVMTPYLIITRPRQALPDMQSTFTGYPSFITKTLSACNGFTTVQSVHLENIPATATEISEIDTLLMQGVIF